MLFALWFLVGGSLAEGQDQWGHLGGRIVIEGKAPEAKALTVDKDAEYCLRRGEEIKDRSILVGQDGGLKDVFVMMYFKRGDDRRPKIHSSYEAAEQPKVVLNNLKCRFEPRSLFIRTGRELTMQNDDRIGHNCHVVTIQNEENVNLAAGSAVDVTFANADKVPGTVKCDIHPWMEGIILIRDEPYVAITDENGNFKIENIPAGNWTFQFWHQRVGFMRSLKQEGSPFLGRRGEIEVTIEDGKTFDFGELKFSVEDFKN